jgi:hypothetical protein
MQSLDHGAKRFGVRVKVALIFSAAIAREIVTYLIAIIYLCCLSYGFKSIMY